MAFFDDFSKKVTQSGQNAVQKAKDLADISRINSMIAEEERKVSNNYHQIGKLYVSMHGDDCEQEFVGMISAIAEAEEQMEKYRQQIRDIKGLLRCEKCGAEISKNSTFCSSCGAPVPQSADVAGKIRCSCGAIMDKSMRFCTSCGRPLNMPTVKVNVPEVNEPVVSASPEGKEIKIEESATKAAVERCPNCGAEMETGQLFCTECGHSVASHAEIADVVDAVTKKCPKCGAVMDGEQMFCTECGTKLL